jgi:hypothetical protein
MSYHLSLTELVSCDLEQSSIEEAQKVEAQPLGNMSEHEFEARYEEGSCRCMRA